MTSLDYPALYHGSDTASAKAQKYYLCLLRTQLLFMFLVSLLSVFRPIITPQQFPMLNKVLSIAIAISLAVGLVLIWVLKAMRYEKKWFDARAIAESVKTTTWKYLMGVAPYQVPDGSDQEAMFLAKLSEIRAARPEVKGTLVQKGHSGKEITDRMIEIRNLNFEGKMKAYVSERLAEQRNWYEIKAIDNQEAAFKWFWAIFLVQIIALGIAIVQTSIDLLLNVAPLLMTMAAVFLAWTQTKRYEELNESYDVAAQELRSLETLSRNVTQPQFSDFIVQVEAVISREHTMWCARRSIFFG